MLARISLVLLLVGFPAADSFAQPVQARQVSACRCQPEGKPRKPRFLLPIAGGIGFLPVIAARDSQMPSLALPTLVDIRDNTAPQTALEGERALEVGAIAPDTATALPTIMLIAAAMLLIGLYLILPRSRRRRVWAAFRSRGAPRGGWRLRSVPRRRIGFVLSGVGSVLLLLGGRDYVEGAEVQRQARAEWLRAGNSVVQINAPAPGAIALAQPVDLASASATPEPGAAVPLPLVAVSGREIRRGSPVARLLIPSIDLDEIVMEGVGPVELNGGPGHFPGSVLPGASGNSILSAHRDRHFRRVGELSVGSRIRTETREETVEWVVTERRVVSKDTPALFEESEATLTLTTCWPIRYFGPAPDRLLIIAKRA